MAADHPARKPPWCGYRLAHCMQLKPSRNEGAAAVWLSVLNGSVALACTCTQQQKAAVLQRAQSCTAPSDVVWSVVLISSISVLPAGKLQERDEAVRPGTQWWHPHSKQPLCHAVRSGVCLGGGGVRGRSSTERPMNFNLKLNVQCKLEKVSFSRCTQWAIFAWQRHSPRSQYHVQGRPDITLACTFMHSCSLAQLTRCTSLHTLVHS